MTRWAAVVSSLLLAACGASHDAEPDGSTPADAAGADAGLPATCIEGTALACDCPPGASGYRYCGADDEWGGCECPVPPVDAGVASVDGSVALDGSVAFDGGALPDGRVPGSSCTGDPEWCDGLDNDCDGVVDNGHPCPDSSVRYTEPYDRAVWLWGIWDASDSGLQRVWPTVADDWLAVGDRGISFREHDGALFFVDSAEGLMQYQPSGDPTVVPTPPCFDAVRTFGFDALDNLYYVCSDTLRRNNGELLASGRRLSIAGVLSSGKMVVIYESVNAFFLLDDDGTQLSRIDLRDWVGSSRLSLVTTQGDSAFVAFGRTYRGSTRHEAVVFRVDGSTAEWRLVRRVPVDTVRATNFLPLPDGTVLSLSSGPHQRIIEYPVEGPARVLLRSGADSPVEARGWGTLFAGPTEAPR